ncbi:MAG: hypothetical protein M0P91_05860 [Sulfuricurvum sp.]|jgi:hypothetical protein|uniref:glycine-rich domain-containing protein n=1 Tax=Sulfuricurvum sp. TaxID=2025608 RepID=UPI0025F55E1C|nr:hypothetical protein [Sulfuricurvum sp.]MCK9372704.1 hypothetical protein [Sulfuricurvum sp.]
MEKIIIALVLLSVALLIYNYSTKISRLKYLETYRFHPALRKKLLSRYPHLNDDNITLVFDTLREYFFMTHRAGKTMVSMPSQVVDVAWHEFILFTRSYKEFCDRGLGRFLHHTPTEVMKTPTLAQEGIKRAWRIACVNEKIDPKKPDRLPMIFAIDALLMIPDGYHYVLDCNDPTSPAYGDGYCAGHIGCSSGCSSGCGGDSSCDGGGCGGD